MKSRVKNLTLKKNERGFYAFMKMLDSASSLLITTD